MSCEFACACFHALAMFSEEVNPVREGQIIPTLDIKVRLGLMALMGKSMLAILSDIHTHSCFSTVYLTQRCSQTPNLNGRKSESKKPEEAALAGWSTS